MKCIGVSKTLPVWLFFTKKDYFMLDNDSFKIEGIWLRGKGMINIMTIVDMVISPHNIFKYEPSCFYPFKRQSHKWPNKLKQSVGKLPTNCLSVFDHLLELALKGLNYCRLLQFQSWITWQLILRKSFFYFKNIGLETTQFTSDLHRYALWAF